METIKPTPWSNKQLLLMKTYLPYVVILSMGYWITRQSELVERMREEHNEHLESDLKFAREAYTKSQEAYLFILNHK